MHRSNVIGLSRSVRYYCFDTKSVVRSKGTRYLQQWSWICGNCTLSRIRSSSAELCTSNSRRITSTELRHPKRTHARPRGPVPHHPGSNDSRLHELRSALRGLALLLGVSTAVVLSFGYLYITDTRSSIHRWVSVPLLRAVCPDAEDAHKAGTVLLKTLYYFNLHPREPSDTDVSGKLETTVFGHVLANPLAISAGLDKHAEIVSPLLALGPAIVEIGGVTPLPQGGNPKPRVWRIRSQDAIINRYGLNSVGASQVAINLRKRVRDFAKSQGIGISEEAEDRVLNGDLGVPPGSLTKGKLLAIQIAKNKATPDHDHKAVTKDYVTCVQQLGKYADIIVVNVSSPNTPGLRSLQKSEPLKEILSGVVKAAQAINRSTKPAVMVKVSPDEDTDHDIFGICEAVWQCGVDGVIVGNTTRSRPLLGDTLLMRDEPAVLREQGGYSGPAMISKTLQLIKRYREILDIPLEEEKSERLKPKTIFASGGITTGEDVLKALESGASVAMAYTGITYAGIGFIGNLKNQMKAIKSQPVVQSKPEGA